MKKTDSAHELLERARAEREKVLAEIEYRRASGNFGGADYLRNVKLPKWDDQVARLERLATAELAASTTPATPQPIPQPQRSVTRLESSDIRRAVASPLTASPRFASKYAHALLNSGTPVLVPESLRGELEIVDRNWQRAGHPQQGALFDHMQRIIRACQSS